MNSADTLFITVEFYGLARHVTGQESQVIPLPAGELTLHDLYLLLRQEHSGLPDLEILQQHYKFCLNGNLFTSNLQHRISHTDQIILLSADAGG